MPGTFLIRLQMTRLDSEAELAFVAASALGDERRQAEVASLALETLAHTTGVAAVQTARGAVWIHRLDEVASAGTIHRVWADVYLAMRTVPMQDELFLSALSRAKQLGDELSFVRIAAFVLGLVILEPREIEEIATAALAMGSSPANRAQLSSAAGNAFLQHGDRDSADRLYGNVSTPGAKYRRSRGQSSMTSKREPF